MGESGQADTALEVSVSFGRFENDSLSWEKWSSFSQNKYLEEVGKYSTPGSVAQKKAYFEAHYKKIAAQKAEQSEQDKPIPSPPTPTRDESEKKSLVNITYVGDEDLELSSNGRSSEDLDLEETEMESPPNRTVKPDNTSEIKNTYLSIGEFDVFSNRRPGENIFQDAIRNLIVNPTSLKDEKEDADIAEDRQECLIVEAEEKSNNATNNIESNDKNEAKEELIHNDFHLTAREETANIPFDRSHEISKVCIVDQSSKDIKPNGTQARKNNNMNIPARDTARKMILPKKESTQLEAKKKLASPVRKSLTTTKLSHDSASGLSKSTIMPLSRPSTKKTNKPSYPKSKFTSDGEHRRVVPASLHMSISLDNSKPFASVTTPIRKSLIMEQMGDKDIVKRAFKMFQKHFNAIKTSNNGILSNEEQQRPCKDSEQKVTGAVIPQKEHERLWRSVGKIDPSGELGNRTNHTSLVSHKGSGEKKPIAAESPSTKLKSEAKFEKQKQVEKEANLKKAKQWLNSKAAVTPPNNRVNMKPRILSLKEDNAKSHHQATQGRGLITDNIGF